MATGTIEERLSKIESELAHLKAKQNQRGEADGSSIPEPWWKKFVGIFSDDPVFEEAVRAGQEWRYADRQTDPDEEAS